MASCKKDKDIITTDTQTEEPELLEDSKLRLAVKDRNEMPLEGIKVNLYDGDTLLEENLITDVNGITEYNLDVAFLQSENLFFVAHHEDYSNGYKKILVNNLNQNDTEIILVNNNLLPFETSQSSILALSTFITVSGSIVDANGNGVQAIVYIFDDIDNPTFEVGTVSEIDGEYELFIPANTNLNLIAFNPTCLNYINNADTLIDSYIPVDILEASTTDIVLQDMISSSNSLSSTISLNAIDCDGLPIENAFVSIETSSFVDYTGYTDNQGNFSVLIDYLCEFSEIIVIVVNPVTGLASVEQLFNLIGDTDLGEIEVCGSSSNNVITYELDNGAYSSSGYNINVISNNNYYQLLFNDSAQPEISFDINIISDGSGNVVNANITVLEDGEIDAMGTLNITSFVETATNISGQFAGDLYEFPIMTYLATDIAGSFNVEL